MVVVPSAIFHGLTPSASAGTQTSMGLTETLKLAAATLRDAGVPFALAGSAAAWTRGAPEPRNDIDLGIDPVDVDRAERALAAAGMRTERPPEGWLLKAWDGDVLVDVIWDLEGCPDIHEVLERADELTVEAVPMRVLAIDDVIASKLCAFDEHALDFGPPLAIVRALREQIDWASVRERTAHSPHARGFLRLLEELGVIAHEAPADRGEHHPRVRVVSGE
jgi:hypothetical protein